MQLTRDEIVLTNALVDVAAGGAWVPGEVIRSLFGDHHLVLIGIWRLKANQTNPSSFRDGCDSVTEFMLWWYKVLASP